MTNPNLREIIDAFIERDKNKVDAFTGGGFGMGVYRSIEEQIAFVSNRLLDTMQLLIYVANIAAAQQSAPPDGQPVSPNSDDDPAIPQVG